MRREKIKIMYELLLRSPNTLSVHPVPADVALDHEDPLLIGLAAGAHRLPELEALLAVLRPGPRSCLHGSDLKRTLG